MSVLGKIIHVFNIFERIPQVTPEMYKLFRSLVKAGIEGMSEGAKAELYKQMRKLSAQTKNRWDDYFCNMIEDRFPLKKEEEKDESQVVSTESQRETKKSSGQKSSTKKKAK
jgi:hypothetical protein